MLSVGRIRRGDWMAAKKMFPTCAVESLLGDDCDEVKLAISFRTQAGQVAMQFSDRVDRIRMKQCR
jgi:hypothetical protein